VACFKVLFLHLADAVMGCFKVQSRNLVESVVAYFKVLFLHLTEAAMECLKYSLDIRLSRLWHILRYSSYI
jgi:hypothetical protein